MSPFVYHPTNSISPNTCLTKIENNNYYVRIGKSQHIWHTHMISSVNQQKCPSPDHTYITVSYHIIFIVRLITSISRPLVKNDSESGSLLPPNQLIKYYRSILYVISLHCSSLAKKYSLSHCSLPSDLSTTSSYELHTSTLLPFCRPKSTPYTGH